LILIAEFAVNDTIRLGARERGCIDVVAGIKAVPPPWLEVPSKQVLSETYATRPLLSEQK
jgi:hypothetical protein